MQRVSIGAVLLVTLLWGCGSDVTAEDPPAESESPSSGTDSPQSPTDPTTTAATPAEPEITATIAVSDRGRRLAAEDLPTTGWTARWEEVQAADGVAPRCGPSTSEATQRWVWRRGTWEGGAFYGDVVNDVAVAYESAAEAETAYEALRKEAEQCKPKNLGDEKAWHWQVPEFTSIDSHGHVLLYRETPQEDPNSPGGVTSFGMVVDLVGSEIRWSHYGNVENHVLTVDDLLPMAEGHRDG